MTDLPCSIDNFCCILLSLVLDRLAEGILDRGIVALDKVAIDELHGQGRFAWSFESAQDLKTLSQVDRDRFRGTAKGRSGGE